VEGSSDSNGNVTPAIRSNPQPAWIEWHPVLPRRRSAGVIAPTFTTSMSVGQRAFDGLTSDVLPLLAANQAAVGSMPAPAGWGAGRADRRRCKWTGRCLWTGAYAPPRSCLSVLRHREHAAGKTDQKEPKPDELGSEPIAAPSSHAAVILGGQRTTRLPSDCGALWCRPTGERRDRLERVTCARSPSRDRTPVGRSLPPVEQDTGGRRVRSTTF